MNRFPRRRGLAVFLVLSVLASCGPVLAQEPGSAPPPVSSAAAAPEKRPGRYRLGPLYVTPKFNLGPIGFDTNVLYAPTERQPDFMVLAGPGLDLVLPLGAGGRFYTGGRLDYLYFVRTASQRRFTGSALAGLAFTGVRTEAKVEERYGTSFSRPSYEVNDRIEQTSEGTEATLERRLFSRFGIGILGSRSRTETLRQDPYLGVDLANALTYDLYTARGELKVALSVKTSLVADVGYQQTRYPRDPGRDADRRLLAGGFRTDRSALVAGRLLLGQQWYDLRVAGSEPQQRFYADVDATVALSPKTRFGVTYLREIQDSIFVPEVGTPTNLSESTGLRLEREITSRIDFRLFGRYTRLRSDGEITVDVPDQGPVTSLRDDRIREAGADLGYRFRANFRMAIVATYTNRDSTIAYFGVQGLLVGFNAQLNP